MKHEVKVVMLPTEDKTNIKYNSSLKLFSSEISNYGVDNNDYISCQHLYTTISQDKEPIIDSCWVIATKKDLSQELLWFVRTIDGVSYFSENFAMEYVFVQNEDDIVSFSKIIATTDPKLINDKGGIFKTLTQSVPQLQQSFLEEFVANPDVEYEVEYESIFNVKFKYINNESPSKSILKLNQDNTVNITAVEPTIPIYIHKGIFNTDVQIENGIVHVRPNKISPVKKKMYSREEIEHILIKFLKADKAWKNPKKWIKENL
jgi:hypothetical protein